MLRSYQAELSGTQLMWLDAPPNVMRRQRVLVVVEETEASGPSSELRHRGLADLVGRLQWQGDPVQTQRDLRDDW